MINVSVLRDSQKNIVVLRVEGHSGFNEKGKDIVCSGVSAIVQTAYLGLVNVLEVKPLYKQEDGLVYLKIPSGLPRDKIKATRIVLDTMLEGLRSIEAAYGEYITIREG